jgi:xanthosine utilization system XapX-like protein
VIALVGLLGILLGEQIPPLVKGWLKPEAAAATSWLHHQVKPHMFGELPKCGQPLSSNTSKIDSSEARSS